MRSALVWDFTQRKMVIPYRRFGTDTCSEISGRDYLYTVRKNHIRAQASSTSRRKPGITHGNKS